MKILRHASAFWKGAVPTGTGAMTLGRDGQVLPFTLKARVEENAGTNPEELVGAALVGCYSMALSSLIEEAGKVPGTVETSAKVIMEQLPDGFAITQIQLVTRGKDQDMTNDEFVAFATKAKTGCPVSKLYASAEITLDAALA